MDNPKYLLDANVFIEAARRYYAFDIVSTFWPSLIRRAQSGAIASIDRIRQQLEKGKDRLAEWAKKDFADAFLCTDDADVTECYRKVIGWVQSNPQFTDAAKAKFAQDPDGWLVAFAMAKGYTVVTHEEPAPEAKKKVPIPNVCDQFKIRYMDTFKMLRELGIKLA